MIELLKKSAFLAFTVIILSCAYPNPRLSADTIFLKNGRSIEGIVKNENGDNVEISVGFGTITCSLNEISKIEMPKY